MKRDNSHLLELTDERRALITKMQGGKVDGLEAIAVARDDGTPRVLRVATLVKDKPFPTLFWLCDPELVKRISKEESAGLITHFQTRVDHDAELRKSMKTDHEKYVQLRKDFMSEEVKQRIKELNFEKVLEGKGIGGLEKTDTIRCLHTWYAAHLVVPNTIGQMLETYWKNRPANPSAAQVGNILARKKTTFKNLCTAKNLTKIEAEIIGLIQTHGTGADEYLASSSNFRKEMLEAYELYELIREKMGPETALVDVGCSHGLTSFLVSCYLNRGQEEQRKIVWIDADPNCKAAKFAEQLKIPFHEQVRGNVPEEGAMVLVVNVCGNPLLDIIKQCKNVNFCVVPCCGPEGVRYEEWLLRVSNAIGKPTRFVQLENNLKRTAILTE